MIEIDEKLTRRQMFIPQEILDGIDGKTRNALFLSPVGDVVLGILPAPRTE
jgi:hypothetical protein